MNVLIFGATGMIGSGVLLEALDDPEVESVRTVGRSATGRSHRKLREVVRSDLFDWSDPGDALDGVDACLFCLGASSAGMREAEYHRLTHDLTVAVAGALATRSPEAVFCFVSGAGTDSTEQGRVMWARVKGKAENAVLGMPFRGAYVFRPGYIQPLRGVRSRTRLYAALYRIVGPLYPLLRRIFPRYVTDSVTLGRAMLRVARDGYDRPVLESDDINRAGGMQVGSRLV